MEEKNLRFGQMHSIIAIIAMLSAIEYYIKDGIVGALVGIFVYAGLAVLDLILTKVLKQKTVLNNRLLIAIRIVEFLIASAYIVYNDSGVRELEVISFICLLLRMIEMIFLFDYSDRYTRTIIIGVMIFPITLFVLIKLLLLPQSQNYSENAVIALGSIAEIAPVVCAVVFITNIFISWILEIEHKIFEQRRMAEKTAEMNETLTIHQEKIKKANEELGIQRIKMESANRQVQRANAEIKTQNEILLGVTTCLDIQSLADKVPEVLCDSMENVNFCSIILAPTSKKGNFVYNAKAKSISGDFLKEFTSTVINKGLSSKDSKEISIDKELAAPCYKELGEDDKLAVVVKLPLFNDKKEVGIIYCGSGIQDNFDESESLLKNIAAQVILGINNIQLYYAIRQMAVNDGLTGIFNRRSLNEHLAEFGQKAEKEKTSLSVALFDIDHFKGFNDTYGHACGDLVLQKIAGIIDKIADRNGGIAARYGGEEFVLAFPECDADRCEKILIDTKAAIDKMVVEYEEQKLSVHVSIGYSSYPSIRKNTNELLGRADTAMYFAKEHGRNQIKRDGSDVEEFESERNK